MNNEEKIETLEEWKENLKDLRLKFEGEEVQGTNRERKHLEKLDEVLIDFEQYCENEIFSLTVVSDEEIYNLKQEFEEMELS